MSDTITWPELVELASTGLASREPFDIDQGDLMARGIVAMDAELRGVLEERRAFLPTSARPPRLDAPQVERCLFCGTSVTPGQLIGNTLANGAMPKMAEHVAKATRLYTNDLGALRKRVAELEAGPDWAEFRRVKQLADAADKAIEVLEEQGEQARRRIAELEGCALSRDAVFAIALEVIEHLTGGNFGDHGSASAIADRVMGLLAGNSAGNQDAPGDPNAM